MAPSYKVDFPDGLEVRQSQTKPWHKTLETDKPVLELIQKHQGNASMTVDSKDRVGADSAHLSCYIAAGGQNGLLLQRCTDG
jgi:hypothetical protein